VTVHLDDDREVEDISCTCPYDWGEHCKHEVASLYALRDLLAGPEGTKELVGSQGMGEKEKSALIESELEKEGLMVERPRSVDLRTLLQDVSKEDLLTFLVDYATNSPSLTSALVHTFPSSDEDLNLINLGIEFRRACVHGGEITYFGRDYEWEEENEENYIWNFTSTFKKKIEDLLEMIRVAIMVGRIRYGLSIASMMVHEISVFDCNTDHIGEDVEKALSQIVALFAGKEFSSEDTAWLFERFFAEVENYDIEQQTTLLRLCIHLADSMADQNVLEHYLVELAEGETEGYGWGFNSTIKSSVELRHALLLEQQRVAEAQAFALENLRYDSMRKLAYDRAMATGEYPLAERLALGKEEPERRLSSGPNWGELLFRVYQESGDIEKMRELAKSFLYTGDLAYYPILKESYTEREWEAVLDGLLDELQNSARENWPYTGNPYPKVLKLEKEHQRLLVFVQENCYWVREYQDVLLPQYQDEVFALYKQIILKEGRTVASRSEYRGLASWLESLVAVGGSDVAKGCVEALEPRYKKRPAMKDELRKVGLL